MSQPVINLIPKQITQPLLMVPFQQTQASVHLDALRAVAAIVVLGSHWRALLFFEFSMVPNKPTLPTKLLYLLTQGGHSAVVVFFVLSGYLISGSIFRGIAKGSFSFLDYLTHRLARLWAVLVPAMLIGGLMDYLGIHTLRAHALYAGKVPNYTTIDTIHNLHLSYAIREGLFLQRNTAGVFGSNISLWSLSYEFWYYVLFPIGFLALSKRSWQVKLCLGVAFGLASLIPGYRALMLFPLWLAGAAVHYMPIRRLTHSLRVFAAIIFACAFTLVAAASHRFTTERDEYILDVLLCALTVIFLWILLSSDNKAPGGLYQRLSMVFSSFSYSLYANHFPILLLFTAIVVGTGRWSPTGLHVVIGALGLAVALVYSYCMYLAFERHTGTIQKLLFRFASVGAPKKSY